MRGFSSAFLSERTPASGAKLIFATLRPGVFLVLSADNYPDAQSDKHHAGDSVKP